MNNKLTAGLFAVALAACTVGLFGYSQSADALAQKTTRAASELVTIGTTAEDITDEFGFGFGSWKSCRILNDSATILYVGGSDVDTTDGYPICNASGCDAKGFTVDGSGVYAVVASSTLNINVICTK